MSGLRLVRAAQGAAASLAGRRCCVSCLVALGGCALRRHAAWWGTVWKKGVVFSGEVRRVGVLCGSGRPLCYADKN